METIIENEGEILLNQSNEFEKDKQFFIKEWYCPFLYTDEWREQVKENYLLPKYGCDDPNIIFGDCDSWNHD